MKKNSAFKIAVALTSVLQAGLSAVVPVGICMLVANLLIKKLSFPQGTMLFALVLGVLSGFYNMFRYIKILMSKNNDDNS